MKTFAIGFALLELASISYAAPGSASVVVRQTAQDVITFQGAGPNPPSYTLTEPNDGSIFRIGTSLFFRPVKHFPYRPLIIHFHHSVFDMTH